MTFEQSSEVFKDPMALTLFDQDHTDEEDRWITLGLADGQHYLVIVHTYRDEQDDTVSIRLILPDTPPNKRSRNTKGDHYAKRV